MSKTLTATDICSRALRLVGKFPVTESAPDGESLREAMFWLDMLISNMAAHVRLMFLVPDTLSFAITPGTREYNLPNTLLTNYPTDGIQFPVGAWLEDDSGNRYDIEIVKRETWQNKSTQALTGIPCEIYIDRLATPTLWTYPTLPADATTVYTLYLDVETFAPNVSPSGVSGTQVSGSIKTGFREPWQIWLVIKLAIYLGSGAITKITQQSLNNLKAEEKDLLPKLLARENREHDTENPIVEAWGT